MIFLIIIIIMVLVIMQLIVGHLNMIMIEEIVEALETLTMEIEEDLMKEHQEKVDLINNGSTSCAISVTTLDT